jgi:hypothetical protein
VGQHPLATPGPCGAAWWVLPTLVFVSDTSSYPRLSSGPKKSTKSFAAFGLRLIGIFCKSKTGQKTATGTWHYVNRLVPKIDIKLIGIHSKTSKIDHKIARNNQKLLIRWRRINIPKLNSCSSSSRKVIKIEFLMWSANNHAHHNLFL